MKIKTKHPHAALLLLFLAVVIGLIYVLKNYNPPGNEIYNNELITVTNKTYFNKLYRFRISVPTTDWSIIYYGDIDSLYPENPERSVLDNINLMAKFERKHKDSLLAITEIGVIDLSQPAVPHLLARQCLKEMTDTYSEIKHELKIVKDVAKITSGPLKAAYFIVELPVLKQYPFPKWIFTFIIKDDFAYSIICQVSVENYNFFREDFRDIIASFNFI